MAMRPTNPSRLGNRVYEQFSPLSEWKREGEADLLLVFLPGFMKENIRVTTETKNIIRVFGERLVAGNKCYRFREDFQIPENCNIRGISAKFERGILTITMQWKAEFKTTQTTPTSTPAPTLAPAPAPAAPAPAPAATTPTSTPRPQEANAKPRSQATAKPSSQANVIHSQAASSTSNTKKTESTSSQAMSTPKPANSQNFTSTIGDNKSSDSTSLEPPRPQNVKDDDKKSDTTSSESNEIERPNTVEMSVGKEDIEKKDEEPNQDEMVIKKIVGQRDEEKSGIGGYSLDEYKQLKGIARGLNEERELMVNMGAAVLVILALGTYISYTSLGN